MSDKARISVRYKFGEPDPDIEDKAIYGPRWVEVSLGDRSILAREITEYQDWSGKGHEVERGEIIEDEAYYYFSDGDLVPPRGSFIILDPDNVTQVLAIEMINCLLDGSLPLNAAKCAINIILPYACKRNEDFCKIIAKIKPYWLKEVTKCKSRKDSSLKTKEKSRTNSGTKSERRSRSRSLISAK